MNDEAIDTGPVVARLNELSLDCVQFSAYRVCQVVTRLCVATTRYFSRKAAGLLVEVVPTLN